MNKNVPPKQLELTADKAEPADKHIERLYAEQNTFLAKRDWSTPRGHELGTEPDDFDWNDPKEESIILREQRATAVYRNRDGELVVRQRCWPDDDVYLIVTAEMEVAFMEGLAKRARET